MKGPTSFTMGRWLILFQADGSASVYDKRDALVPVCEWSRLSQAVRWCEEQENV